jgi:hypothetical protein
MRAKAAENYAPNKQRSSTNEFTEETGSCLGDHSQQECKDRNQEGVVEAGDREKVLRIVSAKCLFSC